MSNRLTRWLARKALARALDMESHRKPDFEIISTGGVYLQRWWLIPRNGILNIYLHHMLLSDDEIHHDHMYPSVSLVLDEGITENYRLQPPDSPVLQRTFSQGDVVWRSSVMSHQLVVNKPSWTIFVTGPRLKQWGFWCPQGWRHWKEYVEKKGNTSGPGLGCGEV